MITDNLFKTFKILLGNSRAFHLTETNISNISKSFLKPFEDLIRIFRKIVFTPFVSQNTYSTDNEQKQDVINFETQFDVNPTTNATITERAKNIEAQFGLVGGQSWKYIQNSIKNIGIDARVIENIPVKDLISTNLIQYGNNQYNGQYAMYGKSGYLMLGNGTLQFRNKNISETDSEIINKDPITIDGNTHLFLIESSEAGPIKITSSQLNILIDLLEVWKRHNQDGIQKYQNTFAFNKSPECIFVRNKKLEPATFYSELDEIPLTQKEKEEADKKCKEILASGGYNGNLFLLRNLVYDPDSNILYIECVRAQFSVVASLSIERRKELGLYKVSVLSPTITSDNDIVFLERSTGEKQYCSVAGFLESKKEEGQDISDLIMRTAIEENIEEIYGDNSIFFNAKFFNFRGISFTENRGFVEFVVSMNNERISTDNFLKMFRDSHAKDRHEHTQNFLIVPLQNSVRTISAINCDKIGGFFYVPISMICSEYLRHHNVSFKPEFPDKNCENFTTLNSLQFKTKISKQILCDISTEQTIENKQQINNDHYFLSKVLAKKSESVRLIPLK